MQKSIQFSNDFITFFAKKECKGKSKQIEQEEIDKLGEDWGCSEKEARFEAGVRSQRKIKCV